MWIDNPYRTEVLTGKDGKTYEVLYYYTDLKAHDDKITNDEITPVVLQDGKLLDGVTHSWIRERRLNRPSR